LLAFAIAENQDVGWWLSQALCFLQYYRSPHNRFKHWRKVPSNCDVAKVGFYAFLCILIALE